MQVGGTFAPRKDTQGLAVVDLVPGDYVVACFVPARHVDGRRRRGHRGHRAAALHERHDRRSSRSRPESTSRPRVSTREGQSGQHRGVGAASAPLLPRPEPPRVLAALVAAAAMMAPPTEEVDMERLRTCESLCRRGARAAVADAPRDGDVDAPARRAATDGGERRGVPARRGAAAAAAARAAAGPAARACTRTVPRPDRLPARRARPAEQLDATWSAHERR